MSELSPLQELLSVSASKYFDDYTIKKSEKYLLGVRITNYHVVDNSFIMANISGTSKYLTSINVVDGALSFKCNCPKQGLCKHEAALFRYAQNKLGLKIDENSLLKKNIEEFYREIKSSLNDRSYISVFNSSSFRNQLIVYKNELGRLKDKEDMDSFIKLFVRVALALERLTQGNSKEKTYNEIVNSFYDFAFLEIANNISIFDNYLSIEYSYTKAELLERLLYILINNKNYNSKLIDYISDKINSFTSIQLFKNDKERIEEKIFFYKTSHEIENGDYSKIPEIKNRLQLIDYRVLYVKYLIQINDIDELTYVYNTYDNYSLYPKILFELMIDAFEKENKLTLCESIICNYFKHSIIPEKTIKEILDIYSLKLSKDFLMNAGLSLYSNIENRSSFKILLQDYPEYEIFYQAYKSFTSFDNKINEYNNYDETLLKQMYYLKVQEILDEDYVISSANKKNIMRYVKRLDSFTNGKYYIQDLIDYFYQGRYNFSFNELTQYLYEDII